MIQAALYKVRAAEAKHQEAVWASWWPQMTVIGFAAPAPPARGDAVRTDTPYPLAYGWLDQYGLLTRLEVSMVWPLYTFGKVSLYQEAAKGGIRVAQENLRLEQAKLAGIVRQAFYGLQLAESSLTLLDEMDEYIGQAKDKLKTETDKLKIEVMGAELQARKIQAQTGKQIALSALTRLTGLPLGQPLAIEQPELEEPDDLTLMDLSKYLSLAEGYRPELQMLRHGTDAKLALLKVEQRSWLPDFFIAGFLRASYSTVAQDQLSPFARDDFIFFDAGVGLGLRFDFDIPVKLARIRHAEAEFAEFQSQRAFARQGIAIQIEQHYREALAAQKTVAIYKKARKAADKWMTRTMLAFASGLVETRDVSDALLAAAKARGDYIQAIYALQMALAHLSRSVGIDIAQAPAPSASTLSPLPLLRPQ